VVRTHERAELGAVVIWCHEQVALVLVGGITGRRLSGGCQALEIELVRIPLAVHLGHYVFVVVIPARESGRKWSIKESIYVTLNIYCIIYFSMIFKLRL